MITKVVTCPRTAVQWLLWDGAKHPFDGKPWHLVSIYGEPSEELLTGDAAARLRNVGMAACMSERFWDITDNPETLEALKAEGKEYVLFDRAMARRVSDFIAERTTEPGDDILVCQCGAGVSRSGAVGAFACEVFGLDCVEFLRRNHAHPNPFVLRLLREEAGLAGKSAFMTALEAEQERQRVETKRLIEKYGSLFV